MCLVASSLCSIVHNCTHVCPFPVSFSPLLPVVGCSPSLAGYYGESFPPGALVWKPGSEWWEVVLKWGAWEPPAARPTKAATHERRKQPLLTKLPDHHTTTRHRSQPDSRPTFKPAAHTAFSYSSTITCGGPSIKSWSLMSRSFQIFCSYHSSLF